MLRSWSKRLLKRLAKSNKSMKKVRSVDVRTVRSGRHHHHHHSTRRHAGERDPRLIEWVRRTNIPAEEFSKTGPERAQVPAVPGRIDRVAEWVRSNEFIGCHALPAADDLQRLDSELHDMMDGKLDHKPPDERFIVEMNNFYNEMVRLPFDDTAQRVMKAKRHGHK